MPDILDAVNAALTPSDPTPPTETTETPEVETPEITETPETPEVETPETPEVEETPPEEGAAEEVEKTPEQLAADEAEKAKKEKPMDAVNDPIPATAAPRTQERLRTLISSNKELTSKLTNAEKIVEQHNTLLETINSTGASPEEFSMQLSYAKLIHSDNIDDKRQAYNILLNELKAIAPLVGEVLPGDDPLRGHEDLRQEVAAKAITPERAAEIAKWRNTQSATQRHSQQVGAKQESQQQFEQATAKARGDLNALGESLRTSDADFQRKYDIIVPALKPIFADLHPSKWVGAFQQAWNQLKLPPAPAAAVTAPKPPVNQPLRANKSPSGGGVAQPKSAREAIDGALANLRS
jgi:hypothetical protein